MAHLLTILRNSFTPHAFSGLSLWLDAQDTGTLALSGANVTQWNDKSGYGNHAMQGTASRQPVVTASGINGRQALQFFADGSIDFLTITDAPSLNYSKCDIFLVVMANTANDGGQFFVKDSGAPNLEFVLARGTTSKTFQGYFSLNGTGYSFPATTATLEQNAPAICTVQNGGTGGNWVLRINDNAASQSSSALAGNIFNGSGNLFVGAHGAALNNPFRGFMGEALFYSRQLNADERNTVLDYLRTKWGIA